MTGSDFQPANPPAGSAEWDAMYGAAEQVWSGAPNGALVAELSHLPSGAAVDVGCGEGADAVWLAQLGWQVTAFDVSATALARAATHAAAAGVRVRFVHAGLLDLAGADRFDLVNVQYPALLHEDGRSLAALLDLVAPGGTLLFVHHADLLGQHSHDHAAAEGEPDFDPADYLMPADVHAALGDGWTAEVFEERARTVTAGKGAGHTRDLVLRAVRTSPASPGDTRG
jgi:SAM-dependent methyltransferase